ncbi:MAG: respiratory nitrate reductase subunit gamma [Anaerolineae bacterium UTCFX2]|jgi:nitrate reductase gamma subunit|nr:respiratory nitrate reductase subunit gamma [Anaerolineales bacterium]OQY94585.1 MAG: respiratory nitrate reductase subunit gamma [Anaerolineae bacterium UTCFX2]
MNFNTLLFMIFPYVSIAIFIIVTIYRSIFRPFTVSSLSSQLLERRWLYWGSISFHWGVALILTGHLLALLVPQSLVIWNAAPLRLYLLELTALALGIWCLAGLVVLTWRRLSNKRIRVVTTPMDLVIMVLLLASVITGVTIAIVYRFGSYWFTSVFSPYLWSILTLQPQPAIIAPLPWVIQLHMLNFFVLLAVLPFSRLIHILTYPLGYLLRPWQIVVWYRRVTRLDPRV